MVASRRLGAMSAIVSAALLASCSAAPGPVLPPPEAPASATEEPFVTTPASQFSAACEEWDPRELEWRSLSNPTEAQRADDAGVDVIVSRASLPASSSSRYNTGVEICPGFLWLVTHSGDSVFVSLIDDTWAQGPSLIPSGATDNVGARGVESGGPVWGFRGSVGATEWLYLSDAVIDTTAQCVRLEVHRLGVSALLDGNSSTDVIYESDPCVDYASTERGITPIKTHLGGALAYSEDNDELGSTIVYVTHDQYEAMTFAEELLVMSAGEVVQHGTPETLFERPINNYVGYFIGSPAMNFLDASVARGKVTVEGIAVPTAATGPAEGAVQIGIRPEYVRLVPKGGTGVTVTIDSVLDQGNTRVVTCRWGAQSIKMKLPREVSVPRSGDVSIELPADKTLVYAGGNLVQA